MRNIFGETDHEFLTVVYLDLLFEISKWRHQLGNWVFLGQETRGKIWARDRRSVPVYLGCNEKQALVGVRFEGRN